MRYVIKVLFLLTLSLNLFAQTKSKNERVTVVLKYSNLVHKTYIQSLESAKILKKDIDNFLLSPSILTLEVAKNSWKLARAPYGQSEVFRFYNGPIDREGGPEGLLNAWPLDEAYIDYVVGASHSGIINNTNDYPLITKELISNLNELDGEKNISTGYHAIEFLLWGQDLSINGPGARSFEDYIVGLGLNADRRREYLKITIELLVEHLQVLVSEWEPNKQNFRAKFETQENSLSLKNILSGIIYMSGDELSGERMYVAYETMGQEDEHSCFSDMTHMDIQWNYWGVENVLNETKILELPELRNTNLASALKAKMGKIHKMLASLPTPFDQAILSDQARPMILESIEGLESLAQDLVTVSENLNVKVDF